MAVRRQRGRETWAGLVRTVERGPHDGACCTNTCVQIKWCSQGRGGAGCAACSGRGHQGRPACSQGDAGQPALPVCCPPAAMCFLRWMGCTGLATHRPSRCLLARPLLRRTPTCSSRRAAPAHPRSEWARLRSCLPASCMGYSRCPAEQAELGPTLHQQPHRWGLMAARARAAVQRPWT